MTATKTLTMRILAHWGQETGFRLGGASVVNVANAAALNREISQAINEGDVGILAIPLDLERWISEKNLRALARNPKPLLARYDYPGQWRFFADAAQIADALTYRALGYHMRIKL
ncbi:MAG: hypothetical protein HZB29_01860 [Nitrospinae bacterium]|nr:hypothetical protein [Nitrospinota bacterium]